MNKTIWSYWDNSDNDDNLIIENCIKTWYKFNNSWNIIILNKNNINEYVKNIPKEISNFLIQSKTDYYRIYLLYNYGGAWIDAAIFLNMSIDYFIKNNENKCILFKERININENIYCAWMIISLYKNNLFLKNCLDELLKYFNNPKKFLINIECNYNECYLKYQNWCNYFNSYILNINEEVYSEIYSYFYLYLIFIKLIDYDLINNNLIYFYDALEFGRYHKKFANNFQNIIENFKILDIYSNNFIKLGSAERRIINNIIKSKNFNENSFINRISN